MNFMLFSDNTQDTDTNVFPMIKHPFHQPRRSGCCYNVEMFSSFPSLSIKEHEHMFGFIIFLKNPLTSRFHLDGIRRLLVFFPMAITFMYCLLASYTPTESKLRAKKNISCQCPTPQKPQCQRKNAQRHQRALARNLAKKTRLDHHRRMATSEQLPFQWSIQSRVGWVFQPLSVNVGSIARWTDSHDGASVILGRSKFGFLDEAPFQCHLHH